MEGSTGSGDRRGCGVTSVNISRKSVPLLELQREERRRLGRDRSPSDCVGVRLVGRVDLLVMIGGISAGNKR